MLNLLGAKFRLMDRVGTCYQCKLDRGGRYPVVGGLIRDHGGPVAAIAFLAQFPGSLVSIRVQLWRCFLNDPAWTMDDPWEGRQ